MNMVLFSLIVVGLALAPGFTIALSGLLIHHGIWSVEWAVPTLFFGVTLRYFTYETTRGGLKRSYVRAALLLPYTVALLLLGLYVTHVVHVGLSPLVRVCAGVLLVAVAFLWLARLGPRLPAPLAAMFRRLPEPTSLPRGARRLLAALVIIPFWPAYPAELESSLSAAFSEAGLEPDLLHLKVSGERPRGLRAILGARRVLVPARRPGMPTDIYLARVMFDYEGRLSHVTGLFNISDTASVDEVDLHLDGRWASWSIRNGAQTRSIEVIDLGGERVPSGPGWSLLGRIQRRITNLQQTGQFRGVGRATIPLSEDWGNVETHLGRGELTFVLGERQFIWELGREPGKALVDAGLTVRESTPARPGSFTTWAVDRLRQVPFIGSDGMQWLKGVLFLAAGEIEDLHAKVVGVNAEESISEELGEVVERLPIARESEIPNWPPAPLKPLLSPALPSEGEWVDLGRDVLSGSERPGGGAMLFTFVRVDPKRSYNQVSITLWDPRRIDLHIVAGTEEPQSTLGQQGTGLIPRDPAVLKNLMGAFNGAFQAVHGEFGMMERRVVQLPPKPYAATVATFEDGSAGFGTWPPEPIRIPADMIGPRQNMTPLVADSRANPYARHWWGGVPEGWTQETRTVRSGLCLTKQKHIAYLYSTSIDPDRLAQAMLIAGCTYGIHLDMNAGHAGFELYHVEPTGALPSLGRPLDPSWEATGKVPGLDGYSFLARLMVKKMPLMNFPRYIHETPRDFFYLTKRDVLPGPTPSLGEVASLEPLLPIATKHNDYPYFVVRTTFPAGALGTGEATLQRFDPRQLTVSGADGDQVLWFGGPGGPVAQGNEKGAPGERAVPGDQAAAAASGPLQAVPIPTVPAQKLWFLKGAFGISDTPPSDALVLLAESATDRADLYCLRSDGLLDVVEIDGKLAASKVEALVPALECEKSLRAPAKQRPRFEAGAGDARAVLSRSRAEPVRELFPKTPIVLPGVWGIPQAKRVDYVP